MHDLLAEREGFEPPVPYGTPDFESGTFDHYATSPVENGLYLLFAQKWQFNTGKISVPRKFSKFTRLPESDL